MHHDVVEIHPETSIDRTPDPAGGPRSQEVQTAHRVALTHFSHAAVAAMRRRGSRPEPDLAVLNQTFGNYAHLARGSSWAPRR